jgi:replicative DNA helicase
VNERTPPHSSDAELAIIGAVFAFELAAHANAGTLALDDFYIPAHREAWRAIAVTMAAGTPPSPISVQEVVKSASTLPMFEGGFLAWAISTMEKACQVQQVAHYAQIVREKAKARALISVCIHASAMAYGDAAWEDTIEVARDGVAKLESENSDSSTVHISVPVKALVTEMQEVEKGKVIPSISSCLESLDNVIIGHYPGQLIIVSARPGEGKSIHALGTCAANAVAGVPALMFPLEMSNREQAERALISDSRIAKNTMLGGLDFVQWKKIYDSAGRFENSKLYLNDRTRSLPGIVGETRRWHAKYVRPNQDKRGIVAVDYAQIVGMGSKYDGSPREQQIAKISGTLKSLARELEIPIILVAQLNRECVKRGGVPQISDLRESGALEQDADVILLIHHDLTESWIIVGKNRGGATGKAGIDWKRDLFRFESNGSSQLGEL